MTLLKFSPLKDNAKLKWMGKNAYSFSLLSGWSCPNAHLCQSRVVETEEGRRIKDGKNIEFRCFSASQELVFKNLYLQRKHNFELIKSVCQSVSDMKILITNSLPKDAKVVRLHIAGDHPNQRYFDAWLEVAIENPTIHFYGYTKSLRFWINRLDKIPENLILTASLGGNLDHLIQENSLRFCKVVYSEYEARKLHLPIDTDDKLAMLPKNKNRDFAIVVHSPGPKGSKHALAWKRQIDGKNKFHGYTSNKPSFGKYYKENYNDVTI